MLAAVKAKDRLVNAAVLKEAEAVLADGLRIKNILPVSPAVCRRAANSADRIALALMARIILKGGRRTVDVVAKPLLYRQLQINVLLTIL
jgi:hypothetical protein